MRAAGLLLTLALAACATTAPPAAEPGVTATPVHTDAIGRSHEGRALEATTLGRGPRRVYVIAGIHGDEPTGARLVARLLDWLAEPGRLDGASVRVVHDVNPDGNARGTRSNARAVDLNRNWPADNFSAGPERGARPLSEPETMSVHVDIGRFEPELLFVFHEAREGPFVNFDGPGEELAEAFAEAARAVDPRWRVVADMGYRTPGSLGSLFGVDGALPILTIEFERGGSADAAWPALQAGMDSILRAGLVSEPVSVPF
jgi:protein MpaA